jgi:hypothetical protein
VRPPPGKERSPASGTPAAPGAAKEEGKRFSSVLASPHRAPSSSRRKGEEPGDAAGGGAGGAMAGGAGAAGAAAAAGAALAGAPPAWQRAEGAPLAAAAPRAVEVAPMPATAPLDRLLMGFGPQGVEVRLHIGQGMLAGSEIHLRQGAGGIDALVLTRVESSRQTLAVAMDEVARRLHRKGYVFRPGSADPGEREGRDPRRQR